MKNANIEITSAPARPSASDPLAQRSYISFRANFSYRDVDDPEALTREACEAIMRLVKVALQEPDSTISLGPPEQVRDGSFE